MLLWCCGIADSEARFGDALVGMEPDIHISKGCDRRHPVEVHHAHIVLVVVEARVVVVGAVEIVAVVIV